jgi:hypothetical protein
VCVECDESLVRDSRVVPQREHTNRVQPGFDSSIEHAQALKFQISNSDAQAP